MSERKNKKVNVLAMIECALFVALIAVGAFIRIPLPVMPFTLQVLFTNLAGLFLGKRYGAIAVSAYIALGLIGLPIFTSGGGLSYIVHPTFGYMIGMIMGTYMAGYIREKIGDYEFKTTFEAGMINLVCIYLIGVPYFIAITKLYLASDVAISTLLITSFVLTLPVDVIKIFISSLISKRIGVTVR